jgi:hypothetical protein
MDTFTKQGVGALQKKENDIESHSTNLFKPVSQEIALKSGRYTAYQPVNLSGNGPYVFDIHPQGMQYIDRSATRLLVNFKVVNSDGSDLAIAQAANGDTPAVVAPNVSCCNLPGNSLWQAIDVDVGGNPYPHLGNVHANYKAYIETLLSYTKGAAESHLQSGRFLMDVATKFEEFDATDVYNIAFARRKERIAGSKTVQCYGPVHCDFLQDDRLLPPGVRLTLKFYRAPDNFVLMSNDANKTYKIIIEDLKLFIRHVTVSDRIVASHIAQFEKGPAIFPFTKTVIKTQVQTVGITNFTVLGVVNGLFPKTIIFTFLSSGSLNGSYMSNPYNFQHFGLNFACLRMNGEQVPSEPYRPDFTNGLMLREFREFYDNIGVSHDDLGSCLTPALYKGGAFMMAFDLSPDMCNGFHCHPKGTGYINLELGFKAALTENINVLTYCSYDAQALLDKDNIVHVDIAI